MTGGNATLNRPWGGPGREKRIDKGKTVLRGACSGNGGRKKASQSRIRHAVRVQEVGAREDQREPQPLARRSMRRSHLVDVGRKAHRSGNSSASIPHVECLDTARRIIPRRSGGDSLRIKSLRINLEGTVFESICRLLRGSGPEAMQ